MCDEIEIDYKVIYVYHTMRRRYAELDIWVFYHKTLQPNNVCVLTNRMFPNEK